MKNCILSDNSVFFQDHGSGGACLDSVLINCTLIGNSARSYAGGVLNSALFNCITYLNTAGSPPYLSNWDADSELKYCCTIPMPTSFRGIGNITNEPLFVDRAGGNLRLQSNSPCINAGFNGSEPADSYFGGFNGYSPGDADLDGLPRISGGTVDIGAYEFQNPTTLVSIAWLLQYGLAIDGSADTADPDGDGLKNWQEWQAGTDPTNALSVLRLLPPSQVGSDLVASWESVPGGSYSLERSTILGALPLFESLATNLTAQGATMTYTHTNAAAGGPWFYRVGVQ